jgi:transposase-like protein
VCAFLVQQEDEATITKMLEIFKSRNERHVDIKVVITDKDMGERKVFKTLFPQVEMQICLFHVLRTFTREFTIDKMGITLGERTTLLTKAEALTYAKDEEDYIQKYADFVSVCPHERVRNYYDAIWHPIKKEWVEGLTKQKFNFDESTNNRLESFFKKLKAVIKTNAQLLIYDIPPSLDCFDSRKSE